MILLKAQIWNANRTLPARLRRIVIQVIFAVQSHTRRIWHTTRNHGKTILTKSNKRNYSSRNQEFTERRMYEQ